MSVALAPMRRGFSSWQYAICLSGITWREALRFLHQRERFVAALVRPLVWLFIFAAGFRQILGVSIIPPYQTYILYDVFVVPGLIAMIQLFNGMQSSLSMVYDREMGNMRMLLVSPFPRWFLLISKLFASTGGLNSAGLYVLADFLALWDRDPGLGISGRAAGTGPERAYAWCAGNVVVVSGEAAGKFRWRYEFCDFPYVFCVVGTLSAVAGSAIEPTALRRVSRKSIHVWHRAGAVRAIPSGGLAVAGGGCGGDRAFHRKCHSRL